MYPLCENSFTVFSQLVEKIWCFLYIYSPNLFCKECVENIKENWNVHNVKYVKCEV